MADGRVLCWFSCGAPSAVAAKLALGLYGRDRCEVVYCDTGGEHEDNRRFLADVTKWLRKDVTVLKNPKYADHFDVFEKDRFIVGPTGARCRGMLKRDPRLAYQRPGDLHVWGYTADEQDRIDNFRENNPELACSFPLADEGITWEDCLQVVRAAGIALPVMYRLGFRNNNCLGCVKGGMGYWNRVRRHFPGHFARMAVIERDIGHSILKDRRGGTTVPLYLDELDPAAGRDEPEPDMECGLMCHIVSQRFEEVA
jgi:3'-phosphoadenosine 5'-phosphosulfate sulfotransferase (PAPS reductase)/FAD synthetase